jgi:alpha/beta superfamily hydrolase
MADSTVERAGPGGAREIVGLVGPGPERLAGATHVPEAAAVGGLLVVPSICNDLLRGYRREVALSRRLASQAVAVQRFHYRGTGNSEGEELDLTFDAMVEDAAVARMLLTEAVGALPLAFLGTRFGAIVAAAAARQVPGAPLVLVDPTVSGEQFFREAWRARSVATAIGRAATNRVTALDAPIARGAREGTAPITRETLLAQLEEHGRVDVLGHTVGQALYQSSSGRSLVDELGPEPRPVLLVQMGGQAGLRPDNERLKDALEGQGSTVDIEIAGEQQRWWFFDEDEAPPENLGPAVAAWVAAHLADAAPAPAPRGAVAGAPPVGPSETPGFFTAGGEELFGILTEPEGEARGTCAVLLSGGSWTASPGHNRIWVRLARELATEGYHALRLDYHGVGESTGNAATYLLDAPFVEDALGGCSWVEDQGVSRMVLLGTCFGARTALAAAERLDDVAGVAVFPVPVRDFAMGEKVSSLPTSVLMRKAASPHVVAGLFRAKNRQAYRRILTKRRQRSRAARAEGGPAPDRSTRVSPILLRQLESLVDREIPVLLIFGEQDWFYEDFRRALGGRFRTVLDRAGDLIQLRIVPGKTHGLTTTAVQDAVVAELHDWLGGRDPAVTPDRASASQL